MEGKGKSLCDLLVIGIMEGIVTAIALIGLNFNGGNPIVSITGLFLMLILSAKLTGAHLNPALTAAIMAVEDLAKLKSNLGLAGVMIFSQIVGAYIGQSISYLVLRESIFVLGPAHVDLSPPWKVFLLEIFFTFLLMTSILHSIIPKLNI